MPVTDVTIQHLELPPTEPLIARRVSRPGVTVARAGTAMPELNRFFYAAIGGDWFWLDRRPWTPAQWMAYLERPEIETWVLSVDGIPAGYFELDRQPAGDVEIKYMGLLRAFIGQGLGAHLLTEAVERARAPGASRVLLNTCTLDHPQALANYRSRGFRVYRTEVQRKELPDRPPGPW